MPKLTAAITIFPVFIYMALAGFATPVVRAFIMAAVYLISIVIGRGENKLNTLAVAAFIILIWYPWALFELSFWLSSASVFGIIIINKLYPIRLNTFKDKFPSSVKVTLAASFATLPFIINSFGDFSVVSVPANPISVPLVELFIVPLGLVSFSCFLISKTLARFFVSADIFVIKSLLWGIGHLLKIPLSSLTVPFLSSVSSVFYATAAAAFLFKKSYPRLKFLFPVFILGFLFTLAYCILVNPNK